MGSNSSHSFSHRTALGLSACIFILLLSVTVISGSTVRADGTKSVYIPFIYTNYSSARIAYYSTWTATRKFTPSGQMAASEYD